MKAFFFVSKIFGVSGLNIEYIVDWYWDSSGENLVLDMVTGESLVLEKESANRLIEMLTRSLTQQ